VHRIVDDEVAQSLAAAGALLIEGPRGCGKTQTARRHARSEVLLDVDADARRLAALDPGLILSGARPRLIDEWQIEPTTWGHVRRAVDDAGRPGQFILTGSAVPADDIARHTGAGRIIRLRMRPMTLSETRASTGAVSLQDLLERRPARAVDPGTTIPDLARWMSVGGWPALRDASDANALRVMRGYVEEVRRVDVPRVAGSRRDPERIGRVMRSLARYSASYAAATTIAADAGGSDGPLDDDTVRVYLDALARIFVVEDQPPWAPHLRSRSILRSEPRRHFADPSLAVAALGATPDRLLKDPNLLGLLFESLVIRDLRVYAQASDAIVRQYRDNTGLEVDAIIDCSDGRWAAFEIKLGTGRVEEGAATLKRFAERVDTRKVGPPAALGVIVGTGYGYVRDDGIAVIPIATLGP
jgi:predicted AAA+ superfamily ATPase